MLVLPSGRLVDPPAVRRHPKTQSRVWNVVTSFRETLNVCLKLDVAPHSWLQHPSSKYELRQGRPSGIVYRRFDKRRSSIQVLKAEGFGNAMKVRQDRNEQSSHLQRHGLPRVAQVRFFTLLASNVYAAML